MNQDRLVGTAKNLGGKVEEGFGKATGDASTEASGKMKQVEGDLQDLYGQARQTAGQAAKSYETRHRHSRRWFATRLKSVPIRLWRLRSRWVG